VACGSTPGAIGLAAQAVFAVQKRGRRNVGSLARGMVWSWRPCAEPNMITASLATMPYSALACRWRVDCPICDG